MLRCILMKKNYLRLLKYMLKSYLDDLKIRRISRLNVTSSGILAVLKCSEKQNAANSSDGFYQLIFLCTCWVGVYFHVLFARYGITISLILLWKHKQ